ncbi:MAG: GNAT family N-acetyltransferase [Acidimicrobiales bacterium]
MGPSTANHEVGVRPYRSEDRAGVYDVCVRTGDHGGDATGKFTRPDLLPDIFAGPYIELEPGFAFVVDAGERAVGYVVGTPRTTDFVPLYREKWLPLVAGRYPAPPPRPVTPEEHMLALLHRPEHMLSPRFPAFPAHLHIDILPAYQGRGWGRALVDAFAGAVAGAGASGVHVAVAVANQRAHGFYRRVGFERLTVPGRAPGDPPGGGIVYYGLDTSPRARDRQV